MNITDLQTPAALVDLDRIERNITKLQAHLDAHDIDNRPHIKTHKLPQIAQMQVDAGAVGITCQKVGEAEVMAEAGIGDIFIPYNILGDAKLERLMQLTRRAAISVTGDSETTIRGYAEAAAREGTTLPVLVEIETGAKRCGVTSPEAAATLARQIAASPSLHFGGLMTYPSSERVGPFVEEVHRLLRADDLPVERVSGGGSYVMWQAQEFPSVTEHRAGQYVYGDRSMVAAGVTGTDEIALSVIATVVSRPTADRGVLDSGSKTLSSDPFRPSKSDPDQSAGHGHIVEYPNANFYAMSEEHGHVDFSACTRKPEVGERVTIWPNHCCPVSNLFNEVIGVRGDAVEVVWPVAARGKLQ